MESDTVRKTKKRKRKDAKTALPESKATKAIEQKQTVEKRRKRKSNPLNGLTLAVSTSESKKESDSNTAQDDASPNGSEVSSYKEVCSVCEELGASHTAQVHQRVFALISNKSAVLQCTQRVRKALKKYITIIDVQWLLRCKEEGRRVDHQDYLLNDLAKEVAAGKKTNSVEEKSSKCLRVSIGTSEVDVQDESDDEILNAHAGWSEPVSLDCCCVCHDDDRDDCKWCCGEVKCNVILRKLRDTGKCEVAR